MSATVVDVAGAAIGGAARWLAELDGYLAGSGAPVRVIGRGRRLAAGWLVRRERIGAGDRLAVAANNVSFALRGAQRRVLVRNALHFLYPHEGEVLARMPRAFAAQVPVVRAALRRADLVVAPSSAMAERVAYHVPAVRDRLVVRAHPVSTVGRRRPAPEPFILVPVVPGPHKDLVAHLRGLLTDLTRSGHGVQVRVTATAAQLTADLVADARLVALGVVAHRHLADLWRQALAVYFPPTLESFGYPLAEARAYGVPVLAPDTAQAREIAGTALLPYRAGAPDSLAEAIRRAASPPAPDPAPFDARSYFDWLFDLPTGPAPVAHQPTNAEGSR